MPLINLLLPELALGHLPELAASFSYLIDQKPAHEQINDL